MTRSTQTCRSVSHRRPGFTLIEMMVIVALLGITGTIVAHLVALQAVQPTRHHLEECRKALESYKAANGSYPGNLEALVEKKLLPELPKDQWGHTVVYRLSAGEAVMTSAGPDGMEDTPDDIQNK